MRTQITLPCLCESLTQETPCLLVPLIPKHLWGAGDHRFYPYFLSEETEDQNSVTSWDYD